MALGRPADRPLVDSLELNSDLRTGFDQLWWEDQITVLNFAERLGPFDDEHGFELPPLAMCSGRLSAARSQRPDADLKRDGGQRTKGGNSGVQISKWRRFKMARDS